MSSDTLIPMSQIPDSLLERITNDLHSYSTTLIKLAIDREGRERPTQIGSGTFVSIGTRFGILTAQHVSREIDGECQLGLVMVRDEHVFRIEKDYLNIIEIGSAETPSEGPDLSLIVLPAPKVAAIKAVKSFYNLDYYKAEMLHTPPPLDFGIWFICGAPAKLTSVEESQKGFGKAISFSSFCYATGANRQYTNGDYDYIEVSAMYGEKSYVPSTLGGMSGGGLWQVPIRQSPEGALESTKYLLSGVIFYQSALADEHRFIRCHGRQSIYQNVVSKVEKIGS